MNYPSNGLPASDCLARLVDATYDATVDPLRYRTLLSRWEAFLRSYAAKDLAPVEDLLDRLERGEDPAAKVLFGHFSRAMTIFERLKNARRVEIGAQALADSLPGVGLVVDASGRVVALNRGARALTSVAAASGAGTPALADLAIDRTVVERVLAWFRGRSAGAPVDYLLVPCRLGSTSAQSCLIVTPIDVTRWAPAASRLSADCDGPTFLIASLDLQLDEGIVAAFAAAFQLSGAEGAVAAELARGAKPAEIAARRGASLNTVRSQVKSLTRKVGAEGVADLVRMYCGFAASFAAARIARAGALRRLAPHPLRRHAALTLPCGRRLSYIEQGAARGNAALFLHAMSFGPYWTDRAVEAAARKNWRLIGPWRPGHGDSDPIAGAENEAALDAAAMDAIRLLDHLGLERVVVVAHQTASVHAVRLATIAPNRVRGILALGHLPCWRDEWVRDLPPRMRIIALTARYAPKLLPFLSRAAIAMIDAGEEAQFARMFYHGAERELQALREPEVMATVAEGLAGSVKQGPFAFCRDLLLAMRDHGSELARVRGPIRLLHGGDDRVFPVCRLAGAQALAPRLETTVVPNAGNLLLFTHWPVVIDHLRRLHAETEQ